MKFTMIGLVVILCCSGLWAQTPATPPAAPPMQHHDMGAMHKQHAAEMKAQVEKMRATLTQMKALVGKKTNTKEQKLAQENIELWDAMITHMEGMVKMMEPHEGMGMMGGEDHGMSCCAGMKEGGGCCGEGKCSKPKPAAPAGS